MKTLDLLWMNQDNWAVVASGEGAQSVVTSGKFVPWEIHDFMCSCGQELSACGDASIIEVLEKMKDSGEWHFDEQEKPFQFYLEHECGSLQVVRIDVIKHESEYSG